MATSCVERLGVTLGVEKESMHSELKRSDGYQINPYPGSVGLSAAAPVSITRQSRNLTPTGGKRDKQDLTSAHRLHRLYPHRSSRYNSYVQYELLSPARRCPVIAALKFSLKYPCQTFLHFVTSLISLQPVPLSSHGDVFFVAFRAPIRVAKPPSFSGSNAI